MANALWGNVYYKDAFAGIIREESGGRASFQYESAYLESGRPPIAYTLPLRPEPWICESGLHPFFDNLVAEGWLEGAQSRLLGKREPSRLELLLAFGYDCIGAVSVLDPMPETLSALLLDSENPKEMAVLTSRASLSGVQPKLALIEREGEYRPAQVGELSTHIGKFVSAHHPDLLLNEYLTTLAFKALLPEEQVVEMAFTSVKTVPEPALVIKRFDRIGGERLHFEEFNQLLDKKSNTKYDGAYKDMSAFIRKTRCMPIDNYKLYARIMAGLLLGNTDMHFKNFAMLHTPLGLRLTPSYDQVAASLYQYKTLALSLDAANNRNISELKAKNLIALGREFELSFGAIEMLFKQLAKNKEAAQTAIMEADIDDIAFKNKLIKLMESRWNGTFALIGKALSKKP